jgi:chromosomal replication initiator protein
MAQIISKAEQPDWENWWGTARETLRRELGDPMFETWIRPLQLVSADGSEVKLGAPTMFVRNWVASHHLARIERALRGAGAPFQSISLLLAVPRPVMGAPAAQEPRIAAVPPVVPPGDYARGEQGAETRPGLGNRVFNASQTFDSFVVGPANEFAYGAARALAEGDDPDVALLYIHGSFGNGKSHLLNAAALEARKRGRRALLLGAEDFMRQFLGALHRKDTLAFKDELRHAELLLIDDLQHLCRSSSTISEFLHTVNAFSDLRRRIVIAADRPPAALEALGDDVRSRLTGGLVIPLDKPDYETRLAILKGRAVEFARLRPHALLPNDVLERVAQMDDASPRDLLGVFMKLATYVDLTKKPVTLEMTDEAISQRGMPGRKASIEDIQRKTAEFYKLDIRDLQSQERARRIARPRQVAMYLSRQLTMRSLPEIGRRFGGKDHTTVLHACRRIVELCGKDATLKQEVEFLTQVLSRAAR